MAGFAGIAAVGTSIERFLNRCFELEEPVEGIAARTTAVLVSGQDFERSVIGDRIPRPGLSIFLYRIEINKSTRAAWSGVGSASGRSHLPVDLHYILTAWGENAEAEHRILGKTLQCLDSVPVLTGPLLHPSGGWAPNESVQLLCGELSTEELMRTFDSLPIKYRLSICYVARLARIDGLDPGVDRAVMTAIAAPEPM